MQRTACVSFLDTIHRAAPFFEELARYDMISAELIEGKLARDGRLSTAAQQQLAAIQPMKVRDQINFYLQMQVAVGGPKVFAPTLEQCLAVEQVAPRLPINQYVQPYPTMVIELPEG